MSRKNYIERSKPISCEEARQMMPGYLKGTLTDRELAAFLHHIRDCTHCAEELETDFMIEKTIHYLNTNEEGSFNLRPLLQQDIRDNTAALLRRRKMRRFRTAIIIITVILAALLILDLTGIFRITVFMESLM